MDYKILPKFYKAFSWCTKNNIRIYPKIRPGGYILVYEIDGFAKTTGKIHPKTEYQEKIVEFYIYLYEKFHNNEIKNISNG